jgi:hypothetical protein
MPTIAPCIEPRPPRVHAAGDRANDLLRDDSMPRRPSLKPLPTMRVVAPFRVALPSTERAPNPARGLPARMQQLIELHGGTAVIAEQCGFSEGAVRSWRDGRGDISRERCVTIARTLGISLPWLVAGEGPMSTEAKVPALPQATSGTPSVSAQDTPRTPMLDARLLAAALRLLQSYIGLVGGSLDPNARADRLAELYDILGHAGSSTHASRLIDFHHTLGEQLRRDRPLIA